MPKTAIDYSKTIIYKICCDGADEIYVGSTTDFRKRKNQHKFGCYNEDKKAYNLKIYQTIRANGGWDNWRMVEIEVFPCNSSVESRIREEFWRNELEAKLNMVKAYVSEEKDEYNKKYRQEHKEEISKKRQKYHQKNEKEINEKSKKYYQKNKEEVLIKMKEKITCECGKIISKRNKSDHLKTLKHLKLCPPSIPHGL
jgi:hypothetical protein